MGSKKLESCGKGGETQEKVVSSLLDCEPLGRNCIKMKHLALADHYFSLFLLMSVGH